MGTLQINGNTIIKNSFLGLDNSSNTFQITNTNGSLTIKRNDYSDLYLCVDKIGNVANIVNNNRSGWSGFGWVNKDTSKDLAYLYLWVDQGEAYKMWIGDSNNSEHWWWQLTPDGTMTTKKILFPATALSVSTSDPMAITYGRISCYGTLCINANTDNSGTEYVILTAGKGLSSSATDGLAIGTNSLTWKNSNILTASNFTSYSNVKMTVLWTNSSNSLGATTISLNLSGYNYIMVIGMVGQGMSTGTCMSNWVPNTVGACGHLHLTGIDFWQHARQFYIRSGGVEFTSGYLRSPEGTTHSDWDNRSIPYQIIGIKLN